MIRLGLCCQFFEEPIKFNTTTVANLRKKPDPIAYLSQLVFNNLASLKNALIYCKKNGIGCFRVGSDFLPAATHSEFEYGINNLHSAQEIEKGIVECKQFALLNKIRLSFHPDQFVVLNSPHEKVLQDSIKNLQYHADLAERLGADVINIHAGGVYGDKKEALKRLTENIQMLPNSIRQRLTLENDDKSYTPEDLLALCSELNVPLVYDVHHHRCLKDNLTVEEATAEALKTWNREPLFHVSSPLEGWEGSKPYRHHNFIDITDFPACWNSIGDLTVEIEAKYKELAIRSLRENLIKNGFHIM